VRPTRLTPVLRGIVLVRQPALGLGLDFQGIGLSLVRDAAKAWCGSAPESTAGATNARDPTCRRLFAAL
jgi:hypothetical protein